MEVKPKHDCTELDCESKTHVCPGCDEPKSLTAFGKDRRAKKGHAAYCASCHNKNSAKFRAKYSERNGQHDCAESGCASEVRTCTKCGITTALTEFHLYRSKKNGHHSWCKECQRASSREDSRALYNKRSTQSHDCDSLGCATTLKYCNPCGIEHTLIHFSVVPARKNGHVSYCKITQYKHNAIRRGYDWCLTSEQALRLMSLPCFYCLAKPKPLNGIDRLDNAQGYVTSNVVPCCAECNFSKREKYGIDFIAWALRLADGINSRRPQLEEILRNHGRL